MARLGKLGAELPSLQRRFPPQVECKVARAGSAAQQARVALQARSEAKKGKKVIASLEERKNKKKVKAPEPSSSSSSPSPVNGGNNSLLCDEVEKELRDLERSSYGYSDNIDRELREWEMMCFNGLKVEPYWEVVPVDEGTGSSNNEASVDVKGFKPLTQDLVKGFNPLTGQKGFKPLTQDQGQNVVLEVKKKTSSTTSAAANDNKGTNAKVIEVKKKTSSATCTAPNSKTGTNAKVIEVKKKTSSTTATAPNSKTAGRTRIGPCEPIRNKIKKGLVKFELNLKEERDKEERERLDISLLYGDVEKELRWLERICYTKEERVYKERERKRMVLSVLVEWELRQLEEICYAEGEREMQEREMQAREEREKCKREKRERGRSKRERGEREEQERERTTIGTLYDATAAEILKWKMQYLYQNVVFLI